MKTLHLTKGYVTIVDDETYKWASQLKWYAQEDRNNLVYAKHGYPRVSLHRLILGAQPGEFVDHIDGDGLNNRKRNLRICTNSENSMNRRPQKGTSIYKGVYWHKDNKKWRARIRLNGKLIFLGYFNNEITAARAYDKKARELFGEFANLNFKSRKDTK
jgi:hypothetical protein